MKSELFVLGVIEKDPSQLLLFGSNVKDFLEIDKKYTESKENVN